VELLFQILTILRHLLYTGLCFIII